jgi:hypothetical protein
VQKVKTEFKKQRGVAGFLEVKIIKPKLAIYGLPVERKK